MSYTHKQEKGNKNFETVLFMELIIRRYYSEGLQQRLKTPIQSCFLSKILKKIGYNKRTKRRKALEDKSIDINNIDFELNDN